VKTLDLRTTRRHNQAVGGSEPLRQAERLDHVRSRAEAAARAGSAAAALALVTGAAEDAEQENPWRAAVLLADASWYARMSHGAPRSLQLARAAALLADGADGDVAFVVHARLGDALQWNGRYAEAQREWLRAAAMETAPTADLLCQRSAALLRAGELARGRESAYAAAARARDVGERSWLRDALTYQVISEIHLGLLPEATASAREFAAAVGAPMSGDRLEALGLRAWVDALTGDERSCRACIAEASTASAALGFTIMGGMAAGLLSLSLGRYDEAVDHLEAKLSDNPPVAALLSLRPFLEALVEACVRAGRRDRANALVAETFEAAVETRQPRYVSLALRMRAVTSDASTDFEAALAEHARWGNRFEEGRTRLLYGEALRRAKRRAEAREQLSAAASAFAFVSATTWRRRALEELRAAGARLPRVASGAALTAQEQRVALLVAEGLSNKEVASRLVVSTKTVEGHLRNIFEKLGVTSRAQVARALER